MRLRIPLSICCGLALLFGCALANDAAAAVVTFQGLGVAEGDNINANGVVSLGPFNATFSNTTVAKYGGPRHAFGVWNNPGLSSSVVYDMADASPFADDDNWFITDLSPGGDSWVDPGDDDIAITFGTAVKDLSFLVADLESLGANEFERMVATAYDSSDSVLETITLDGGTASGLQYGGDGEVQTVSFGAFGIKKLVIDVNRWNGDLDRVADNNRFGIGIDNITATPVPEPSALAGWAGLTVMGLFGVGLRRRRKRQAA